MQHDSFWDFVLLWNLFESRIFNSSYSPEDVAAKNLIVPKELVEKTLVYFKKRYVKNGQVNEKFQRLKLRTKSDKQSLVKGVLLGNNHDECAIVEACIIIIGRYRNNLFHGLKEIASLNLQKDNFDTANEFLMSVLENNTQH